MSKQQQKSSKSRSAHTAKRSRDAKGTKPRPPVKAADHVARELAAISGPRAVACPTCKAKPGSPCKRPSGHAVFGGGFHAERRAAVLEQPADVAAAAAVAPAKRPVSKYDRGAEARSIVERMRQRGGALYVEPGKVRAYLRESREVRKLVRPNVYQHDRKPIDLDVIFAAAAHAIEHVPCLVRIGHTDGWRVERASEREQPQRGRAA